MTQYIYLANRVLDKNGIADSSSIFFYLSGTTTLIDIYSDPDYTIQLPNPLRMVMGAAIPPVYWQEGSVRVVVTDSSGEIVSDDDPYSPFGVEALAGGGGMSAIGYQRDNDTDLVHGSDLLNSGPVYAIEFGVSPSNTGAANVAALGRALDYVRANGGQLILPAGELLFNSDVVINPFPTRNFLQMSGQGSGENGTFLHFTSGSLKVHCVHQFSDFRITSDDSDGINILPGGSPINYPARSGMRNIHAVDCAGDGIAISSNWIYLIQDCYARYNAGWGIAGRASGISPYPTLACNALTIVGGEFQGNGTRQGTPVGANGGTLRGTGGGIHTGQAVQVSIIGSSIEGNKGDGLKLGEQSRGISVIGAYFEKNGSHEANRDICNDQPSSSTNGPNSVYILNSQYTPQDYNGNVQERAIELWDVVDLRITSPQFFTSGGNGFSLPPIYVRESTAGRCSGWVEGRYYTSIGAYPVLLTNETRRFGFPRVQQFSPDLTLPQAADTTSQTFYVDMPAHFGQQVDIDYDVRPMAGNSVGQEARIVTHISRGPMGTVFATPANQAVVAASYPSVKQRVTTFRTDLPGTSVEIAMQRNGTNALDTALGPFRLMGVRVTTYAGVVTSLEKT